jgi:D-alanyl-D-alanine carboxypeptidase/D-alanyl-D-alanine-endopeptidase (penicillin-binding protein 4)
MPYPFSFRLPGLISLLILVLGTPPAQAQPATEVPAAEEDIRQAVTDTIEAGRYSGAFWGIEVTNLRTGRPLFRHHPSHLFTPASNTKLLTAAAALRRLGPDYRYETGLYVDGAVRNEVLHGNLIVRGSGDPTLGGYQQRNDPTAVFRDWVDSLKAAGITRIEGAIVGDDDPFSDVPLGEGWSWNDVPYAYAAEINGLVFNNNAIDLEVRGRRPGAPGQIAWTPFDTDFVRVRNQTRTVPPDSSSDEEYDRPFGKNVFTVRSRIHPREIQEETLTITEPTRYFTHVLREVLLQEGISVQGRGVDVDAMPIKPSYTADSVRQVGTYRSPPLRRIVRTMNHESQNLYAEQLLRTLAIVNRPDTTSEELTKGSSALGALAVRTELAEVGVDTSRVQLVDGSGLSRKNYLSPRAMTRLLETMWVDADSALQSAFYESLPTGGTEGTLEYRYKDGAAARNNVQAKTGTLSGVSALSGYVQTAQGTPLSFVIFCNHHMAETDAVRAAQDAIVNALAELSM